MTTTGLLWYVLSAALAAAAVLGVLAYRRGSPNTGTSRPRVTRGSPDDRRWREIGDGLATLIDEDGLVYGYVMPLAGAVRGYAMDGPGYDARCRVTADHPTMREARAWVAAET